MAVLGLADTAAYRSLRLVESQHILNLHQFDCSSILILSSRIP
jgi:hypothetical protein